MEAGAGGCSEAMLLYPAHLPTPLPAAVTGQMLNTRPVAAPALLCSALRGRHICPVRQDTLHQALAPQGSTYPSAIL